MTPYRAFVVALDRPLMPEWSTSAYAEGSAKVIAEQLINPLLILGDHATRAIAESRFRAFKRSLRAGETAILGLFGQWLPEAKGPVFLGKDTLPDDVPGTAIPVLGWIKELLSSKAEAVIALLDLGCTLDVQAELEVAFAPLRMLCEHEPRLALISSNQPGEPRAETATLKTTTWSRCVASILSGTPPLPADGAMSLSFLQQRVEQELPRLERKHLGVNLTSTPLLLGNPDLVLADLSHLLRQDDGTIDRAGIQRIIFRSQTRRRVRDLSGFRKTFQMPSNNGPSTRKFLNRCAEQDLKQELDEVYTAARDTFGYKRKDLEITHDFDGTSRLRTPEFEYSITLSLDPEDLSTVLWLREISQCKDLDFIRSEAFQELFGTRFEELVFDFETKYSVAGLIDRLEEHPLPGLLMTPGSDSKTCEIRLKGMPGMIEVQEKGLTIRGRSTTSSGLLDFFLEFLKVMNTGPKYLALQ